MWLVVEPERRAKTARIMEALREGSGNHWKIIVGSPPRHDPFVVWGHMFTAERIVPRAMADGTEWWLIDNGYIEPAGGSASGYYSLTRNGVSPVLMPGCDPRRLRTNMAPWRRERGDYVLLAMPGANFGRMLGINTTKWRNEIFARIRAHTNRPILTREKGIKRPLEDDILGAHCVVAHSSKLAVDAVRMGIPAIVEPMSPAAAVCSTDLADIERPPMPSRKTWWASLMHQQFTLDEMRSGVAHAAMQAIREAATGRTA